MKLSGSALLTIAALAACPALAAGPEGSAGAVAGDRRIQAAKLAGLVGFVNMACPDLRSDPARFKAAIEAMGVRLEELEEGELLLRARSYVEAYRGQAPEGCKKAVELFGQDGKVLPDIIVRK
jgi:hypothetical protein